MRISELSAKSGVSLATIKYYLREGLLPPGDATAANQATYADHHLQRLRLIRALVDVGRLSVAQAREVIAAVDAPDVSTFEMLGVAHASVTQTSTAPRDDAWSAARAEIDALIERHGWHVHPGSPGIDKAADAVRALRALGQDDLLGHLDAYADAARRIAEPEVDAVLARTGPAGMVEAVVTGTVLGEVLLNALRLLAQQDASARRLGEGRPGTRRG